MKRYTTVENAVTLAIKTFEANHIVSDTESIRNRIYSWYSHSDVTDPEVLAACGMEGWWYPAVTYDDMLRMKENWFPENPYEEVYSWGFKTVPHDMIW